MTDEDWVNTFTYKDADDPSFIDAGKGIQVDVCDNWVNIGISAGAKGRTKYPDHFEHAAWQTLYGPEDIDNLITALQYAKGVLNGTIPRELKE